MMWGINTKRPFSALELRGMFCEKQTHVYVTGGMKISSRLHILQYLLSLECYKHSSSHAILSFSMHIKGSSQVYCKYQQNSFTSSIMKFHIYLLIIYKTTHITWFTTVKICQETSSPWCFGWVLMRQTATINSTHG